jgi:hypothetical protein
LTERLQHVQGWTDRASLHAHNGSARFQGALVEVATKVEIVARNAPLYTMSGHEHIGPANKA